MEPTWVPTAALDAVTFDDLINLDLNWHGDFSRRLLAWRTQQRRLHDLATRHMAAPTGTPEHDLHRDARRAADEMLAPLGVPNPPYWTIQVGS